MKPREKLFPRKEIQVGRIILEDQRQWIDDEDDDDLEPEEEDEDNDA